MVIFHSYVSLPEGTTITMVYGRYNELVKMGINSWFINQQTLLGGDWNMAGL